MTVETELRQTPSAAQGKGKHYHGVDFIRLIAATLVMGLHLGVWGWWPTEQPGTIGRLFPDLPHFPELTPYFWWGWVGVQIFFVISGFVIAASAEGASGLKFVRSRFLRLYPTAWICASISFAILLSVSLDGVAISVFKYINTLVLSPFPVWVDGVYWTIAVELVFYAVVFLFILTKQTKQLHLLIWVLAVVSGAFILAKIFGVAPTGWATRLFLLQHGVFFALGMWMHRASRGGANHPLQWIAPALLMLLGSAEIYTTAAEKLNALVLEASLWPPVVAWILAVALMAAAIRWSDWLSRLLAAHTRSVRIAGLVTYPLYLCHSTVGGWVLSVLGNAGLDRWFALVAAVCVCFAVSIGIVIVVEPPLQRATARLFDRSTALVRNQAPG